MAVILTADANPGTAAWATASHTVAAAGVATILAGNPSITVAVDASLNGAPVVATLATTDATATHVETAVIAAGTLTITANANATADTDVNYIIALAI